MFNVAVMMESRTKKKYEEIRLSEQNLSHLNSLIELLEPFRTASEILSAQNYVTASFVIPMFKEIQHRLEEISEDEFKDTAQKLLLRSVNHYLVTYSIFDNLHLLACSFLDPKTKKFRVFDKSALKVQKKAIKYIRAGNCARNESC